MNEKKYDVDLFVGNFWVGTVESVSASNEDTASELAWDSLLIDSHSVIREHGKKKIEIKADKQIKNLIKEVNEQTLYWLSQFNEDAHSDRVLERIIENAEKLKDLQAKRFGYKTAQEEQISYISDNLQDACDKYDYYLTKKDKTMLSKAIYQQEQEQRQKWGFNEYSEFARSLLNEGVKVSMDEFDLKIKTESNSKEK